MAGECKDDGCPVDFVLKKISGPWTTHILWVLRTHGVLRYGEIRRLIPDISPKMLAERLKRLEADGLVTRDYQPTIPPTVSYSLTKRGVQLKAMLDALGDVAIRWRAEDELQSLARQHLAGYKVPKSIRFIDSIPKTAVGKLQRRDLREKLQAEASSH